MFSLNPQTLFISRNYPFGPMQFLSFFILTTDCFYHHFSPSGRLPASRQHPYQRLASPGIRPRIFSSFESAAGQAQHHTLLLLLLLLPNMQSEIRPR
jgi:hypothetical protein